MARKYQSAAQQHAASSPRKPRWRAVFVLICILAIPVITELALRLPGVGSATFIPRRFEPAGVPYVHNPQYNQFVYQPGAVFASVYDVSGDRRSYFGADGKVVYRLNMLGLRGPDVSGAKPPNGFRVLCLGDSITFGEGVREEDTYAMQLQKLLGAAMPDRKVEVINNGVQGYGTKEEVNAYRLVGAGYQPDVVVIGFYLNDATDFAETIRQNDEKSKELVLSPLARMSKIWEVIERRRHARALQEEFFETTRRSFQSKNWEQCKDALLTLRGDALRWKFRIVVAIFPVLWDLGDYPLADVHKLVTDSFKSLGVEYIDLLDVFRGRDAESLWVHPTDQHPNEIAHRLAAQRIAEYLLSGKK
jgi:hypothetical protein